MSATSSGANAIWGTANGGVGVWGQSTNGKGVEGMSTSNVGVYGTSNGSYGVQGYASAYYGVFGQSQTSFGVVGQSNSTSGVYGYSASSNGVEGYGPNGPGVYGHPDTSNGVTGQASASGVSGVYGQHDGPAFGYGIAGRAYGPGTGVYGECAGCTTGYAAQFYGNVQVNGTLSKSAGSFVIDHPLDPANKVLRHSFVESPDMKNIYDGVVALDAKGEAWVTLPEYFDVLNKGFRYQLTNIGAYAPVFIAKEITKNRFKIAGGKAGMKVSWQVAGTRNDAYARDHRIVIEEEKPQAERGRYYYASITK